MRISGIWKDVSRQEQILCAQWSRFRIRIFSLSVPSGFVLHSRNYFSFVLFTISLHKEDRGAVQMFDSKFHLVNKSRRGAGLRYKVLPTDRTVRDLLCHSRALSLQLFPKRGE